jgi:hypothetical protein
MNGEMESLIQVLSRRLLRGAEKTHEIPQSGMSRPRFEMTAS